MKKRCVFVLVLALLFSLMGCALFQEQQTAEEEADVTYERFSGKLEDGKPNIYLITKGYGSDYWDTLRQGARDAAADYDCNLYIAGTPSESHLELLAALMKDALDMGADAVLISPADVPEIEGMAEEIKNAGIPLIFVDTILNGKEFDVCFATDNMQAGRLAAKETLRLLRSAGKQEKDALSVGIDIGSSQSQTILERLAGFQEYWSNNAPSTWKVIEDIKNNGGDIDAAEQQSGEFMDTYKNLAALVGLNNGSTVGLARGIVKRKRTDLVLVGFDYSQEMQAMIADRTYHAASIVQRQYDMGYKGVEQALKLLSGGMAEYKYVDTGVQQVNYDNVDSPYVQKILGEQ